MGPPSVAEGQRFHSGSNRAADRDQEDKLYQTQVTHPLSQNIGPNCHSRYSQAVLFVLSWPTSNRIKADYLSQKLWIRI